MSATISLFDLDRTGYPNLALMKLSAWHKAQGDTVLPLNVMAPADKRYASTVFSWNRAKAEEIGRVLGAELGGGGMDDYLSEPKKISKLLPYVEAMRPDYSLYNFKDGWGFLMRGCIWDCDFCSVPKKEGKPYEVAAIDDLLNPASTRQRPFVILLDNEFFWREKWAIARLQEFTERGIDFCPSQGLDVRVLTDPLCDALAASPFWNIGHTRRQVTFAFDDLAYERQYRRGVEMMLRRIKPWQMQSYVLVGWNSSIAQDLRRIDIIRSYGLDPFVMVFRDYVTGKMARDRQLQNLARWVNRHLYRTCSFDDYWPESQREAQRVFTLLPV